MNVLMTVLRRNVFAQLLGGITGLVLLFMVGGVRDAKAQAQTEWLNIGDYHTQYSSVGSEPSCCMRHDGQFWPGIYKGLPETGTMVRTSIFIGTTDFTDASGENWDVKVAHTGPRLFKVNQEFFPKPIQLIGRFEQPQVTVDELQSFDRPVTVTEVDPSQQAARKLVREANTVTGITMKNTVRAFGQKYHDDYHVQEYVFTNTGNTDGDPEIELPNQTMEGVYFYFTAKIKWWQGNAIIGGQGTNTMGDYVGDGMQDYEVPYRAHFLWQGSTPWSRGNNLGTPVWNDSYPSVEGDSVGRLATAKMFTRATLYADESAAVEMDDPDQPTHTGWIRGGDPITNTLDHRNRSQMADEYAYMSKDQTYRDYGNAGHEYPHHADIVAPDEPADSWIERMANQTAMPSLGHNGGWVPNSSYGPYTLEPGESIRIVRIEGMNGLSRQAAIEVGKAYKRSGGDDELLIEYDANADGAIGPGERQTKNYWVLSARDSIFKMIERATQNFESGYDIPTAPKPPKTFTVTSGTDRITLDWTTFDDASRTGFEIYRTHNRYEGAVEDDWQYTKVAELGPDETHYEDTGVTRGISYFYYIQAVGEVNTDGTAMTPTGVRLKSSRYYTQTYDPAFLKRPEGESLADARVVPNPYNLGSSQNVRWPDQQDKLAFLEIPGQSTIKIYTEMGELIETIEHTDGSGDEYWNLTTSSNQVVASGIYAAVIKDNETGDQVIKKFVIIR